MTLISGTEPFIIFSNNDLNVTQSIISTRAPSGKEKVNQYIVLKDIAE